MSLSEKTAVPHLDGAAPRFGVPAAGIVAVVLIAFLAVMQGGFSAVATLAAGLAACVALLVTSIVHRKMAELKIMPLLFVALGFVYLASAMAHGLTLTAMTNAAVVFAMAVVALLASHVQLKEVPRILDALCAVGFCMAAFGVLVAAGVVSIADGMYGTRLQGTFQYANAAGCFYGVIALLASFSGLRSVRSFAALPVLALLLTQSAGSALAFLLVALVAAVMMFVKGEYLHLNNSLAQCALAFAAFFGGRCFGSVALLGLAAVLIGACIAIWRLGDRVDAVLGKRACSVIGLGVIAAMAVLACVLLADRLQLASSTLVTRLSQMDAALSLLCANPSLGIAPGNWEYAYPFVQQGVFHASLVHCSYLQVAVDTGIVGLLLIVGIVAFAVFNLVHAGNWRVLAGFTALALHMIVDFDLSFGCLTFMFAMMAVTDSPSVSRGLLPMSLFTGLLGIAICLLGASTALVKQQISVAAGQGDAVTAMTLYSNLPMAQGDAAVETDCLKALSTAGQYETVASFGQEKGVSCDEQALLVARAYYAVGQDALGCQVLIGELEKEPYNDRFFDAAEEFFKNNTIAPAFAERYAAAVKASEKAIKSSKF